VFPLFFSHYQEREKISLIASQITRGVKQFCQLKRVIIYSVLEWYKSKNNFECFVSIMNFMSFVNVLF
jgi:hypothetical protein